MRVTMMMRRAAGPAAMAMLLAACSDGGPSTPEGPGSVAGDVRTQEGQPVAGVQVDGSPSGRCPRAATSWP
jgi:hypothetical protein